MDLFGIRCARCGLMQLPRPTCKSCGKPLPISPQSRPAYPTPPPMPAVPAALPVPMALKPIPPQVRAEGVAQILEPAAIPM